MWHRNVTRSYKGNDTTRGKSVEASKPWEVETNDKVMASLHPHIQGEPSVVWTTALNL